VRGKGLLLAMELNRDMAGSVVMSCMQKGLLLNQVKPNVLRFIPPLIVTEPDVDEAVGVLEEVLSLHRS
jgi:acetylornithine/N-succinyldiaminopimelate aminotransferase